MSNVSSVQASEVRDHDEKRGSASQQAVLRQSGWLTALGIVLAIGYLAGYGRTCGDLAVAALLASATRELHRLSLVSVSLGLFYAAFPEYAVPYCYLACLSPLFYLWRYQPRTGLSGWFEGWIIGFAAAWMAAPFLGGGVGTNGRWLLVIACSIFGLQWSILGFVTRLTGGWPWFGAAVVVSLVAAMLEIGRTELLDFPVLVLALPAAATPLAQWASAITLYGVSALCYFVNLTLVPDFRTVRWQRWLPSTVAMLTLAAAWGGGLMFAAATPIPPLPIRALLIQPHGRSEVAVNGQSGGLESAHNAVRLTLDALKGREPPDLIIWPEAMLAKSRLDGLRPSSQQTSTPRVPSERIDLEVFRRDWQPRFGVPCLIGVAIDAGQGRLHNSACLLQMDQSITRHDKLRLIVLAEALPVNLPAAWRDAIARYFEITAPYTPGEQFHPLQLRVRDAPVRMAISLCFEMHFPSMPQFVQSERSDVIIHMTDESWFRGFAGHPWHGTWGCQYRAIETRRWQLVAANWAHSAVIDPTGRIIRILPPGEGWIDTAEVPRAR